MKEKLKKICTIAALTVFLVVSFYFSYDTHFLTGFRSYIADNSIQSGFIFVTFLIISTVFGPVTILPLLPAFSALFGPFLTAIYSIIGWTIGAIIAFWIARYLGKPVLRHFISLEKLEHYERFIPQKTEFWFLVLVRAVLPVDMSSYAIGLLSAVSFRDYTLATLIGIAPFSFVFAYIGPAVINRDITHIVLIVVASLIILGFGYIVIRRRKTSVRVR